VEEVMLVKLMSKEILFGEDTNRSGRLDENENDADQTDPPDNRNGKLDAGIFDLVTVYSSEANVAGSGSQLVDVNRARTSALTNVLRKSVSEERLGDVVSRARLGRPFANVLDFYFRTGMTMEEFSPIAGQLTTRGERTVRGLINVNTAPKGVLRCLPGLEESDVSALISGRSGDNADRQSIAWVADALPQDQAVGIGSYITARSYQFSADIVSVCGNGRAFRRCRIIVDARQSPPRVIYRQDLTALGWPLAPEILDELRSGTPVEEVLDVMAQEVR
jgi:type II secretory pathway component PulK